MKYGEKELCSKSVSKDELKNYSIGVSYEESWRNEKTAHITTQTLEELEADQKLQVQELLKQGSKEQKIGKYPSDGSQKGL